MFFRFLLLCAVIFTGNCCFGQELVLRNSKFVEQKEGKPADWQIRGANNLVLSENGITAKIDNSMDFTIQQNVNTEVRKTRYKIYIAIKAEGSLNAEFYSQKSSPDWAYYFKQKIGPLVTELKEYSYIINPVATPQKENAVFRLIIKGQGTVNIKGIRIEREFIDENTGTKVNLLTGSSFEFGNSYYTYGWTGYMREKGGYANMPQYLREAEKELSGRRYSEDKFEGEKSLQLLHDSDKVRTLLTSEPVVLSGDNKNTRVVFSIYMKSLGAPAEVELFIYSGKFGESKPAARKIFSVTAGWNRYFINAEVSDQAQASIVFAGKGKILIDAAMLEIAAAGQTEPSTYNQPKNFECFIDTQAPYGIEFCGTPQKLKLSLLNRSKLAGDISGTISVVDYYGKTMCEKKIDFQDKLFSQTREVVFDESAIGYYKAMLRIEYNNKPMAIQECAFAIVPPHDMNNLEDNPFGIHTWPTSKNLRLAKMLGISIIRDHMSMITKWQVIEPEQGKFQDIEPELKTFYDLKLDILGSLDYTPLWASQIRPEYPSLKKINIAKDLWYYARMFPPREPALMIPYIKNIVGGCGKNIKYWETWNEPAIIKDTDERINTPFKHGFIHFTMQELLDSSKMVYDTVKQINPDAVIIGNWACQEPYSQIDDIIKAGGLQYVDKVAVHFYQGQGKGIPPDEPSERGEPPLRQRVEQWQKLMKTMGRSVGLWDTEFGIYRMKSNYKTLVYKINWDGVEPERAVEYIIKSYLTKISLGIEKVFYYNTFRPNYLYNYEPFIEYDMKPQPSAVAFAVMTDLFSGTAFSPDPVDDNLFHLIKTRKGNKFIYAVWLKNAGAWIKINIDPKNAGRILNVMGNELKGENITISTAPVYIISEKEIESDLIQKYKDSLNVSKPPAKTMNQNKKSQPFVPNIAI